ncbi:MAG: AAA family ATPase, partial [Deltaproteobacteria bacterium]|nr:AAA family ATPase [Deltaproteobacteria bacterium]
MNEKSLPPLALTCACTEKEINRAAPDDSPPSLPGQERGMGAVEFGLALKRPFFNITVAGVSRSGKTTMVEQMTRDYAAKEPPGQDISITPNFSDPHRPGVLYLSPGSGVHLNSLIDELLKTLDKQIPELMEQQAVKAHLQEINEDFNNRAQELTRQVEELAQQKGLFVQSSSHGLSLIPLKEDGKPMNDADFIALGVEEREAINNKRREVLSRMGEINPRVMEIEKERRDTIEQYLERSIRALVHVYMGGVRQRVEDHAGLADFLSALEEEIIDKRFLFLSESGSAPFGAMPQMQAMRQQFARNCKVNVLVNRAGHNSAPVLVEDNPNFTNLIGGVDFIEEQGVLKTDFNQIRGGSLIQASGGYLILHAQDLLLYPLAYVAMKRALRTGQIVLRDQLSEMGLRSSAHLEPEAISIDTKVIVVGEEMLIQMLYAYDDDFAGLFKVHADFSATLVRTQDTMDQLVRYLDFHARRNSLLPVSDGALARVVEEASRRVSHQNRLSAQVNELVDVLIESDLVARKAGQTELTREIVEMALKLKQARHGKIEEFVKREISEGTILLDCRGAKVGQVNGLAVYQVGRVSFGIPTRITAQAYAGRRGLINIEREADLSGRIHTKGMLILNGYLGR